MWLWSELAKLLWVSLYFWSSMFQLCGLAPARLHWGLWMKLLTFEAVWIESDEKAFWTAVPFFLFKVPQPHGNCHSSCAGCSLLFLFLLIAMVFLLEEMFNWFYKDASYKDALLRYSWWHGTQISLSSAQWTFSRITCNPDDSVGHLGKLIRVEIIH